MGFSPDQLSELEKNMKRARAIHKASEKGALAACEMGELDASADLWKINALAAEIMSVGRSMKDREGNAIAPRSGDK